MTNSRSKKKTRLDVYLTRSGISETREKAKREILAGWVRVDGGTVTDPARLVVGTERITVARPGGLYVSRGGEKLKRGIDCFGIGMAGRIAADLGASTGGFTDCMLREGAALVYAVDVGYGQLDYRLRVDPRVVVMEKKNVRSLERKDFPRPPDFVAADLSFISILKVAAVIRKVFSPAEGVILIKPQFEAEPNEHKKGVVRSPDAHSGILLRVISALTREGILPLGLVHSPLRGPRGNIEFLLHFRAGDSARHGGLSGIEERVREVVACAHHELGGAHVEGK